MNKNIEKFLKDLKEQQDEIAKHLYGKCDVEFTCKVVFENLPISHVYSDEGQQAIEDTIQQFKENMANEKNTKVSVKVQIKEKPLKQPKKKGVKLI